MKLRDLAVALGCEIFARAGAGAGDDGGLEITGVAGMEQAAKDQLTFLANPKYTHKVKQTRAGAILITEPMDGISPAQLISANPYLDFARALELFYRAPRPPAGIHATASIAPSARIGENASIGPYAVVGANATLGRNAVLQPHVVIYDGALIGDDFYAHSHAVVREFCRIGNRVILQNGAVIGGDGLGFAKQKDGTWYKMQQSGPAVLEDDVEVQSNACVDRATVGETRIGRGTKLDDLVIVGHASRVGANTMLCGQAGLAGSTKVGDGCILAGQVGTAGHLSIGDGSVITAKSGVPNDVPPRSMFSGYPAVDNRQWLKTVAALNRLPELQKRVRELEAELERLGGRPRSPDNH